MTQQMPPLADSPASAPPGPPPRPWGIWATLGFSLIILVVFVAISIVTSVVIVTLGHVAGVSVFADTRSEALASNGLLLAVIFIASAPPCSGLILLFAWLRRKRYPLPDYLGFHKPTARSLAGWVAATVALVIATDVTTYLLGRPVVPAFMVDVYKTSLFPPLLIVVLVVLGPAFEELFFRGFLFEGFRRSFLGAWVTVVLTAAGWAAIHTQYDWYGIGVILAGGLLLGTARLCTNCIWVCMAMHATTNVVATAEAMVKVHLLG